MSKKVLIFGGTRYVGKRLVRLLLDRGDQVTICNRGKTPDPFVGSVSRIHCDRIDSNALRHALEANLQQTRYDLVFDQTCYSYDEAETIRELFEGRVDRYIHTSTASVYIPYGELRESDYDPFTYPLKKGSRTDFDYGETKRGAEALYFQKSSLPLTAVRFPIILGTDDYSGRLEFHVKRVMEGKVIVIPNREAKTSFIHAEDAARFLLELGDSTFKGPINAASPDPIRMGEILDLIQTITGKTPITQTEGLEQDSSPFLRLESRYLNVDQASKSLGFSFKKIRDWMPDLIREIASR